jgi:hypothetical protein
MEASLGAGAYLNPDLTPFTTLLFSNPGHEYDILFSERMSASFFYRDAATGVTLFRCIHSSARISLHGM